MCRRQLTNSDIAAVLMVIVTEIALSIICTYVRCRMLGEENQSVALAGCRSPCRRLWTLQTHLRSTEGIQTVASEEATV